MANIIEKSIDTMKQGLDSLKTIKKDKQEYQAYLKRIQALPDEYRFVYEKITQYMWSRSGGGDGYDMLLLQADLVELFEASAAQGKAVLTVTGEDVAAFSDELLRNARTYLENQQNKLNRDILKKLGKSAE